MYDWIKQMSHPRKRLYLKIILCSYDIIAVIWTWLLLARLSKLFFYSRKYVQSHTQICYFLICDIGLSCNQKPLFKYHLKSLVFPSIFYLPLWPAFPFKEAIHMKSFFSIGLNTQCVLSSNYLTYITGHPYWLLIVTEKRKDV